MNILDHRLLVDADEGRPIPVGPGTFVINQPQMPEQQIVIHAAGFRSVPGAIASMQEKPKPGFNKRSVHLILDKDGKQYAQMVPFNKVANHAQNDNTKSIGIELVYGLPRLDPENEKESVTKSDFDKEPYILASALNDSKFKRWPLYPKAQLDSLLKICQTIDIGTQITDVLGYDEIQSVLHPGPAFPSLHFREQLLGITDRSIVLQKMAENSPLLGRPGMESTRLGEMEIGKGTPVSVINERGKWYLVSVMRVVDGNPWLIGWVKKSAVTVDTSFTPIVRDDHLLATTKGRRFQRIEPHRNGYNTKDREPNPKYIIIHFTTGTRIEGTISHFKSASSGVSTHLLIGRDGRVVQFLPFDIPANHTGLSWWEGERNLNRFSIGIELDNAGKLSFINGKWIRKKMIFEKSEVLKAVHWKESVKKGWEKFPPEQLEVALRIVKALRKKYAKSIVEIIGHDDVNIRNRLDPGPAFPMKDFRFELFKRTDPNIMKFKLIKPATIYSNVDGLLPNLERTEPEGILLAGATVVASNRVHGELILVRIISSKKGAFNQRSGWIESFALEPIQEKFGKKKLRGEEKVERQTTRLNSPFYPRGKNPPTPKIMKGEFKKGTRVRIGEVRGEWTLVVLLKKAKGARSVEGWVKSNLLEQIT